MDESKPLHNEKEAVKDGARVERADVVTDQDRTTFLPRPSDDPNNPLNWPMCL
jgi:hypothetical protein